MKVAVSSGARHDESGAPTPFLRQLVGKAEGSPNGAGLRYRLDFGAIRKRRDGKSVRRVIASRKDG